MQLLVDNPDYISRLNLSISHIERILQVYKKWMNEFDKPMFDRHSRTLTKHKKKWKSARTYASSDSEMFSPYVI